MDITHLSEKHLADLRASGLSDETIAAANLLDVTEPQHYKELLLWSEKAIAAHPEMIAAPSLAFTYEIRHDLRHIFARLKPDVPRLNESGDPVKYESPVGTMSRVYAPLDMADVLQDASVNLCITEGEKKTLAMVQSGLPCVGLAGWYGWTHRRDREVRAKPGRRQLINDMLRIKWEGRRVGLLPDADERWNHQVVGGVTELAVMLRGRGAEVVIIDIPARELDGGQYGKQGIDDFLVQHGQKALCDLIGEAFSCGDGTITIEEYRIKMSEMRTKLTETIVIKEVDDIHGPVEVIQMAHPGVYLDRGEPGLGKSFCDMKAAATLGKSLTAESTHKQCGQRENEFREVADVAAVAYPDYNAPGICARPKRLRDALDMKMSPSHSSCNKCPDRKKCAIQEDLKAANKADHKILTHDRLMLAHQTKPMFSTQYVVINEDSLAALAPVEAVPTNSDAQLKPYETLCDLLSLAEYDIIDGTGRLNPVPYRDLMEMTSWLSSLMQNIEKYKKGESHLAWIPSDYIYADGAPEDKFQVRALASSLFGWLSGRLFRDRIISEKSKKFASLEPWEKLETISNNAYYAKRSKQVKQIVFDYQPDYAVLRFVLGLSSGKYRQMLIRNWTTPKKIWTHNILAVSHFTPSPDRVHVINDATGDAKTLEAVLGVPVTDITPAGDVPARFATIQFPTDVYKSLPEDEAMERLANILVRLPEEFKRIGVITHKVFMPAIEEMDTKRLGYPDIVKTAYFRGGESRGDNRWKDEVDVLIVLGTPRVPEEALVVRLLQTRKPEAAAVKAGEVGWEWFSWVGETVDGESRMISVHSYRNRAWRTAYDQLVRDEIVQAAGRGRTLCADGVPVILATRENLGIRLAPTRFWAHNRSAMQVYRALCSRPSPTTEKILWQYMQNCGTEISQRKVGAGLRILGKDGNTYTKQGKWGAAGDKLVLSKEIDQIYVAPATFKVSDMRMPQAVPDELDPDILLSQLKLMSLESRREWLGVGKLAHGSHATICIRSDMLGNDREFITDSCKRAFVRLCDAQKDRYALLCDGQLYLPCASVAAFFRRRNSGVDVRLSNLVNSIATSARGKKQGDPFDVLEGLVVADNPFLCQDRGSRKSE